ncbi:hypothetical protein pdam_00003018 [Pocillopora damicornis]|uniref:Metalloendopeptidase n=1 Tax=Pocillopora damicornis TaxID=46731 RepID=A0A3M6U7N4_POCDA|nr:hypothetical protein pdam_00003018 [Pocillopora damicornis]
MVGASFTFHLNITGQAHNFNKYPHGKLDFLGAMYDFQSLMHYGSHAFSKNGKQTLKPIKHSGSKLGQRKGFSETDIQQLNALYDCKSESSKAWSSWTKFGPCNDKCQKLPFMATGAAGALGLPVVELVGLAFAPEGGCVTIHVRGMVGKDVMEAAFKLNDARDANVDGTLRKY